MTTIVNAAMKQGNGLLLVFLFSNPTLRLVGFDNKLKSTCSQKNQKSDDDGR